MSKCYNSHHICIPVLLFAVMLLASACGSARKGAVKRGTSAAVQLPASTPEVARDLVAEARSWLGVPYAWGGTTRKGADCSGFLVSVYRDAAGISLPRTTAQQRDSCIPVKRNQLAVGDILFFSSAKSSGNIAHVGMYVGNGRMIHASTSRGVVEDDLSLQYYVDHYRGAGRVPMLAQALPSGRSKKKKTRPAGATPASGAEISLDDWLASTSASPSSPVGTTAAGASITAPPVPEISLDALLAAGVPPTVHRRESPEVATSAAAPADTLPAAAVIAAFDAAAEVAAAPVVADTLTTSTAATVVRNAFGRTATQ